MGARISPEGRKTNGKYGKPKYERGEGETNRYFAQEKFAAACHSQHFLYVRSLETRARTRKCVKRPQTCVCISTVVYLLPSKIINKKYEICTSWLNI